MARGPCNEWTFSKKCNEYKKIKIYLCFIKSFELKIKIICRRNIFFLIYIKVFSSFFFPFLEDKKNQRDGEKARFRQRQKIIIFFISCILFTIFCLCLKWTFSPSLWFFSIYLLKCIINISPFCLHQNPYKIFLYSLHFL